MDGNNKKAMNTVTGKYFFKGKGFIVKCYWQASVLTPAEAAVVRASYDNVRLVPDMLDYDCNCSECLDEEDRDEKEVDEDC